MARGTPDESVYQPQVEAEDLPRKHIPELSPDSTARGIEAIGTALQQKYEQDSQVDAGNKLTDLRLKMDQAVSDAKVNAKPGANGFTGDVLSQFDKEAKPYTDQGGYLGRIMGPGLARMREQVGQEAINYEAQAGVLYRNQSVRDNVDKLATLASTHPEQAQELTGQALAQINGARLGPDVTLESARYAQSQIAKSAVQGRIQTDPYATHAALLKPDSDPVIQGLRPDEREALLSRADAMLHQRVSDAERITSMQEKQEREAASAALSGFIVKSQSPEGLSTADVLRSAALFRHDPSALEAALNLASGKTVETDAHTFLPLFQRAQAGEDVSADVYQHLGRDLSKDDAQKLLSMGDKGIPNAHQQGVETINGIFKQGVFDKYDAEFNTRHMNAVNDYYAWARANPSASAEQATAQAAAIAKSYAQVQLNSFSQTAALPRFAVGNRSNLNPDATESATLAAEKAGRISHAESVQQMGLIQQWRSAMERAQVQK